MCQDERKDLVGWPRCTGGRFEEAPALIGGEVLTAAGVDELEVVDQAAEKRRTLVERSACLRRTFR